MHQTLASCNNHAIIFCSLHHRLCCFSIQKASLLLLLLFVKTIENDKTMVIAVENPAPSSSSSSNADAPPKNVHEHDDTLLLPAAASPVPSEASSCDDNDVQPHQQTMEKENRSRSIATCWNDGMMVVDPSASSSLSSPTKKRRVHSHHSQNQQWNAFVRQGTSLKGLLGDVLQLATTNTTTTFEEEDTAMEMRPLVPPSSAQEHLHAADVAREKTRECMILEKVRKCDIVYTVLHPYFIYIYILTLYSYRNSKRPRPMRPP